MSSNINLIHVEHETNLSVSEIVSVALETQEEIDLVVSLPFDFPEDIPEDFDGYDYNLYFTEMKKEFSKIFGEPIFDGNWRKNGHNDWRKLVCPTGFADNLVVWSTSSKKVYLRHSQIDKEGEIAISFGVENSECRTNTGSECDFPYE